MTITVEEEISHAYYSESFYNRGKGSDKTAWSLKGDANGQI